MRGLSLSLDMARAWHEGRKTVTRRLMKQPEPHHWEHIKSHRLHHAVIETSDGWQCKFWRTIDANREVGGVLWVKPRYQPGEIVYIQEPFVCVAGGPFLILAPHTMIVYQANLAEQHMIGTSPGDIPVYNADEPETWVWRSPVLMPEKLSRSWARITDIWVEQIRDIGFDDIRNEGFPAHDSNCLVAEREVFERYWNSLYPGSWERNDFIWRYGLERVEVEK